MSHYYQKQIEDRARFLRDTRGHQMTIRQDDGLYRHISVGKPNDRAYHFNITTFPGYLVFTGDMGSFVFSRLRDMFDFMSINWDKGTPTIDYRYWAEKAEAQDTRTGGCTEYDHDALERAVKRNWRAYQKEEPDFSCMTKHQQRTVSLDFKWDVLDALDGSDESENFKTIMGWTYYDQNMCRQVSPFDDFWDYGSFKRHTFHFKWACWAIASTIRDYKRGGDRFTRQAAHDARILGGLV